MTGHTLFVLVCYPLKINTSWSPPKNPYQCSVIRNELERLVIPIHRPVRYRSYTASGSICTIPCDYKSRDTSTVSSEEISTATHSIHTYPPFEKPKATVHVVLRSLSKARVTLQLWNRTSPAAEPYCTANCCTTSCVFHLDPDPEWVEDEDSFYFLWSFYSKRLSWKQSIFLLLNQLDKREIKPSLCVLSHEPSVCDGEEGGRKGKTSDWFVEVCLCVCVCV